jgi:hypothetical protein
MKTVQLSKMRALQTEFRYAGSFSSFNWTLFTAKEVREMGIRDPACPVLRGDMGPFRIEIDADGGTTLGFQGNTDTDIEPLNMSRPANTIYGELYFKIHALNPVRS